MPYIFALTYADLESLKRRRETPARDLWCSAPLPVYTASWMNARVTRVLSKPCRKQYVAHLRCYHSAIWASSVIYFLSISQNCHCLSSSNGHTMTSAAPKGVLSDFNSQNCRASYLKGIFFLLISYAMRLKLYPIKFIPPNGILVRQWGWCLFIAAQSKS